MTRETFPILGVKIDKISNNSAAVELDNFLTRGGHHLICTPNVEFVIKALKDHKFKTILNKTSDLNLPDSFGLFWAGKFLSFRSLQIPILREAIILLQWFFSLALLPFVPKIFRYPFPEKVSGSDFVWTIAQFAAESKCRLFLLGGGPTVAERAALKLQTDTYDLRIAGVSSNSPEQTEETITLINKSKADILLVAYGAPKQEKWLADNLNKTNCKIGIGLGGTFDYLAGTKKRAPAWMQRIGLEWLFRLFIEPRRLSRQLSIPQFIWLVLIEKLTKKHS